MPEVADVLRRDGPDYQARFGADLLPSHRRAMEALSPCRPEALGGQLLPCERCAQEHDVSHSCRHRRGPTCHHQDTEAWLEARRQERLPVRSFPVVLTLPQALHDLVRRHPQDLDDILLRAAAHALLTLAADPHDVGGLIGVLGVLHTWSRTLASHPHVHCLVPAGGVSADGTEWRPARQAYLGPVHALSQRFRGLFLDLLRQDRPTLTLPEAVWTTGWVVSCTPTVQGPEQVLKDLGRDCPPDRPAQ
jgi:Putative transposase/Transposase zinc-binding domain